MLEHPAPVVETPLRLEAAGTAALCYTVSMHRPIFIFVFFLWYTSRPTLAQEPAYFHIQVFDAETGRGVPLVELTTVNNIRHITDSAGNIAFAEPGLMDQEVFFHVASHGYEFPKDGFGNRGRKLKTTPGTKATVKLQRVNLAERLYRITGGGIYRDTVLLGLDTPIRQPFLNGKVVGSDSVVNALYRDRLYWFWGDTNRPAYPLGNFQVSGATSDPPNLIDPARGIDLDYFVDDNTGFAKQMAPVVRGQTWYAPIRL